MAEDDLDRRNSSVPGDWGLFGLPDPKVLVAENEAVIALDLEATLRGLGYRISGLASSTAEALAVLAREHPDAALINPRLNDGSAAPLAQALRNAGVPFALVSGRKDNSRGEPALQDAPRLDWPYGSRELQQLLARLLEGRAHGPEPVQVDEADRPGAARQG